MCFNLNFCNCLVVPPGFMSTGFATKVLFSPIITMTAHIGFHPSLLADESPTFYGFFFIIYFILLFISQLFHHLDHVNCPFFFSTTSFLRCGDQNDSPQSRCKHINVLSGKLSLSFLFPVAYMIMKFC